MKLEYFKRYLKMKRDYYSGKPSCSDYDYDMFEIECRKLFPEDDDFYLAGYGQAHEDRLKQLGESK